MQDARDHARTAGPASALRRRSQVLEVVAKSGLPSAVRFQVLRSTVSCARWETV
jgi:hypothetical protein